MNSTKRTRFLFTEDHRRSIFTSSTPPQLGVGYYLEGRTEWAERARKLSAVGEKDHSTAKFLDVLIGVLLPQSFAGILLIVAGFVALAFFGKLSQLLLLHCWLASSGLSTWELNSFATITYLGASGRGCVLVDKNCTCRG